MLQWRLNKKKNGEEIIETRREGPSVKLRYGWKCSSTEPLQAFNKPIILLVLFCVFGAIQGMIMVGFLSTSITQIEKEFGLSSEQIGTLKVVSCTASLITSLFFGISLLVLATGSFCFCVPKLIIRRYIPKKIAVSYSCNASIENTSEKTCRQTTNALYYVVFLIAMTIKGIGCVSFYTVGRSHISNIFSREDGAKYLGVYMALNQLGMSVGYFVSIPLLNIWVDVIPLPHHVPRNMWIGAWWIGFLEGAGRLVIIAIFTLGFPHEFPNTAYVNKVKAKLTDLVKNEKLTRKPFIISLKTVMINPTFIFTSLGTTFEQLVMLGFTLFLPKLHEIQFHFSLSFVERLY